ncbi:MAG: hypothetical protein Q4C05_03085 [Akkermansia sp.]|nr:hypothetical protein [Akkermansia sp.]
MKNLLLLNWPAKLCCLILAIIIWGTIREWGAESQATSPYTNKEEIRRSHP